MRARRKLSRILPVVLCCLVLLSAAVALSAEMTKAAKKGAFVIHNPNAKSGGGSGLLKRNFHRTGLDYSCAGACNCDVCVCQGDFDCCVDGCGICFFLACNMT